MTADTQLLLGLPAGPPQAVEHRGKSNAALDMCLRIEKNLGMHDILLPAALQICPGQVVIILLTLQHLHPRIINIEKRLQIVKLIGLPERSYIGIRQADLIAAGNFKHQLGLKRAFYMQMQFGFRQRGGQAAQGGGMIRHNGHSREMQVDNQTAPEYSGAVCGLPFNRQIVFSGARGALALLPTRWLWGGPASA